MRKERESFPEYEKGDNSILANHDLQAALIEEFISYRTP